MNERYIQRWEKRRRLGRLRFILLYGVVGWGLLTALPYAVIRTLAGESFTGALPAALVVFPLSGVLYGWAMWTFMERRHQRRSA